MTDFVKAIIVKTMLTLGPPVHPLRQQRTLPLRVVAIGIDSTLLSRLELGERFPTDEQLQHCPTGVQIDQTQQPDAGTMTQKDT